MVLGVRDEDEARDELCNSRQEGDVGAEAVGEDKRRLGVMEISEGCLELGVVLVGTANVSRSARSGTALAN